MSGFDRRRFLAIAGGGLLAAAGASVPLAMRWSGSDDRSDETLDLLGVAAETFRPYVGDRFALGRGTSGAMTLTGVDARGPAQFSLFFEARVTQHLPERIHRLSHPRLGQFDLFLTRGRETADTIHYEAAFNHGGV